MSWFGNLEGVGAPSTEDLVSGLNQTTKKVALSSIAFGGIVGWFTLGGVAKAASDGFFLGRARKKGVSYKTIATRNAALGSVFGAIAAYAIMQSDNEL